MSVYRDLYEEFAAHQDHLPTTSGPAIRLIKLQEEAGEVAEAFIGSTGANLRKGVNHGRNDVAKELCDVVITAMVALHDWTDNPEQFLKDQLQQLTVRVKKEGS
jgi:NTP pyrophosphatase (non-canonical NTP hydrolase)